MPDGQTTAQTSYRFNLKAFRHCVRHVAPVIQGRHTIPPRLQLMRYHGTTCLRATDVELDIAIATERDDIYHPERPTVLPLAIQRLVLPQIPAVDISITPLLEDAVLVGIDNDFTAKLVLDQTPEFQDHIPGAHESRRLQIDRQLLARTIGTVMHAISTEETRYYLNGIHIHRVAGDDTAVAFVATDGHRMVRRIVTGLTHSLDSGGIIVPRAGIDALRKLLKIPRRDGPDNVTFSLPRPDKVQFAGFHGETWSMGCRLIDGFYPDYQRVIPRDNPVAATFPAAALRSFCARVAAFGRGGFPLVTLQLDRQRQAIIAKFVSVDVGVLQFSFDAVIEKEIEIGFHWRYLLNALDALKADTVSLAATAGIGPAILATAGELTDPSTTIVLMPMRI